MLLAAMLALPPGVACLALAAGQISGDWSEANSPAAIMAVAGDFAPPGLDALLAGLGLLWLMA